MAEVYRDHLRSEQVYLSTIQETVARREAQRDKFEQVLHKKDEGTILFFVLLIFFYSHLFFPFVVSSRRGETVRKPHREASGAQPRNRVARAAFDRKSQEVRIPPYAVP